MRTGGGTEVKQRLPGAFVRGESRTWHLLQKGRSCCTYLRRKEGVDGVAAAGVAAAAVVGVVAVWVVAVWVVAAAGVRVVGVEKAVAVKEAEVEGTLYDQGQSVEHN